MKRFRDLLEIHGKLASGIKQYEQVVGKFPVPVEVLNEFRYAARSTLLMVDLLLEHVDMNALEHSPEKTKRLDHLFQQAEHAFRCGYHDLVDGLVYELTRYLDEITEGLPDEAILAMGDLRNEILADLKECNELIAASRANLNSRDEVYEEIYDRWFDRLLAHKYTLTSSVVPRLVEVQRKSELEKMELLRLQQEENHLAAVRYNKSMRIAFVSLAVTTVLSVAGLVITLFTS